MKTAGWTPPNLWAQTTLGEVTEAEVEARAPSGDGEFRYIDISAVDNTSKRITQSRMLPVSGAPTRARQRVREGDVLISMTRPNLNAVAYVGAEHASAVASTGFHVLRASDGVRPRWLFYLVQTRDFVAAMSSLVLGVLYPAVRPKDIRRYSVWLPPSAEQDRIVAEIEKHLTRLDAAVAALKRVEANLQRYRSAVLTAACEGRLVPTRGDSPQRSARNSAQGEGNDDLPSGWRRVTMGSVAKPQSNSIFAGPFGTIFKAHDFRPAGVPIIFLRHVAPGRYLTSKPGFMDADRWNDLFRAYSVYGGELLVTKLGEPPGTSAIYPKGVGPAMVTPDVIAMRVDESKALPQYLMHYLNSVIARRAAFGLAFGTTRLRVTLPLFRNLSVPLPPIEEQRLIVDEIERRFSVVDALEVDLTAQLQRSGSLRQALLQHAFQGRLGTGRVDDEPAGVLLERVQRDQRFTGATTRRASVRQRQPRSASSMECS